MIPVLDLALVLILVTLRVPELAFAQAHGLGLDFVLIPTLGLHLVLALAHVLVRALTIGLVQCLFLGSVLGLDPGLV